MATHDDPIPPTGAAHGATGVAAQPAAPVRVGLVGAGPWAGVFTGPMLAAGPDTTLAGVWARRDDAAAALAARLGTVAAPSLDALVADCDAIAFAVPPDVQSELTPHALRAGRPVLLDKPIALTLAQAERLAGQIADAGVVSQVVLTNRYRPVMRSFLTAAASFPIDGARASFVHGDARPGAYFGTPWRLDHGCLLDLGPHVLDALDAAVGPIVDVRAAGSSTAVMTLVCHHLDGTVSSAVMSGTTPVARSGMSLELFGPEGELALDLVRWDADTAAADTATAVRTIASEFAAAVRTGVPHPLDAQRGLHLQRLIHLAADRAA